MTSRDSRATRADSATDHAPRILDVPIGLAATGSRRETDSMGAVEVPANRYWGAQTQRSLIHFSIGDDRMPKAVYHAYGYVKKAAAIINGKAGRLPGWKADLIARVADEVITGKLDENFPLYVWQTGSGTQSNMNVNEVISNRAIQLAGGELGSKTPVHPNDDVNMGQSSNDTFPTAMHIAALTEVREHLLPSVRALQKVVNAKAQQWQDVVKIGRTHLEDAVPLTVGQEWSGYAHQLAQAIDQVTACAEGLHELAAGGTAVGTGLNAPPGFGEHIAAEIAAETGYPFKTAPNKFAAQGSLDAMVGASAGLRGLAVCLMKIANDIRWLASGPRCGISELVLPANEPGSSIMPGKVNPTQCEAMVMVCIQVLSEDGAIAFAGSQGNFELNAMRPVIISNFLHSATILADACGKLRQYCIEGTELHRDQVDDYVGRSLMLVTALSPVIGYDKASAIAHKANDDGTTLRQAALATGYIGPDDFDRIVKPSKMVGNPAAATAAV
jgi:fumarate hydratase, class II